MGLINREEKNIAVTIKEVWLADGRNESVTICLRLEDDAGDTIVAYQHMNQTIIKGGKNRGKTNCEVNIDLLKTLGWSSAPDCSRLGELQGQECSITTEMDEEGKCRVQWLNPRQQRLDDDEANRRLSAILGTTPIVPAPRRVDDDTEDVDEIPF